MDAGRGREKWPQRRAQTRGVGMPTTEAAAAVWTIPLVIAGEAVAGEEGTYPVLDPARPDEVVLLAPSASADQLDEAVSAARGAQPGWGALGLDGRAAAVTAACDRALPPSTSTRRPHC